MNPFKLDTEQRLVTLSFFFILIMSKLADLSPNMSVNRWAVVMTLILLIWMAHFPRHK
jgi:hypothetical protein